MHTEKSFAWELLNEPWFGITEEFEELWGVWYGDAPYGFPDEDTDFNDMVRSFTMEPRYWGFDPCQMTSYEKLRARYETLAEAYAGLIEKCNASGKQNEPVTARRELTLPKPVTAKIKGGCIHQHERREKQIDKTVAA